MYTTIEQPPPPQQQQEYQPMSESQHSNYFTTAFNTTKPLDDYEDHTNTTTTNKLTNSIQKLSLNTSHSHPHSHPLSTSSSSSTSSPDSKKFNFVCVFFNHILNLKDPTIILEKNKDIAKFNEQIKSERQQQQQQQLKQQLKQLVIEIMKNLVFPADIWIRDEIKIKDAKIKTTMLNEVNELIETELKDINDQTTFEEITLNYYAKLLVAYKVYDIPTRNNYNTYPNYIHNSLLLSLEEEEEQQQQHQQKQKHQNEDNNRNLEFDFGFLEKPVYRTSSNQSNNSQKSKEKRSSNGSNLSRKRFLSFLGNNGHGHGNSSSKDSSPDHNHNHQHHSQQIASPTTPTSQINLHPPNLHLYLQPQSQQHHHHQLYSSLSSSPTFQPEGTFNNILTKTKLYGRIKKHRESQASINSTGSQHSINSNRNSVSTNATATSLVGSRRRSNYTINSFIGGGSGSNGSNATAPNPNTPSLSLLSSSSISTIQDEQLQLQLLHQDKDKDKDKDNYLFQQELKLENLKEKYEYYIQILRLFKNSEKILKILINSHNINNKLLKFIEFIKKKLLKFIMIDIMSMILNYCDLQCINFYNIK